MGCASEHSSLLHQSLVQVCGTTEKKAVAKRDRRKTKRTTKATAGGETVNKSCDTCSIKKRRCDGGRPCSRCVRRGDGHTCIYSTRRLYTPRIRRSRLWSSSTSSEQAAMDTASATSGSPCRKSSMEPHCHGNNRDQQSASVVEASLPLGFMVTPKIERSSPAIEEVYAELARAQQSVMSLIVSTSLPPLHTSSNGPYQQTAIEQLCVPCVGDSSKLEGAGSFDVGYVDMMPRTVSLEEQSNPRSSDVPGLEIDCPAVASSTSSALESDSSTTEDEGSDSSTLDLDMNSPNSWSDDGGTIFADVPIIDFDQHLPPTSENITDITAAAFLDQTLSALGQEEHNIISAEDWFDFAANL